MKKILFLLSLILLISLFISPKNLLAVDATFSTTSARINLVFPIAELGNCNNTAECKIFCDNPVNTTVCVAYGKAKDLYKQNPVAIAAKAILGCEINTNSCKEFCAKKENYAKCKSFGEKYLKIASASATISNMQNQAAALCANFCATNPEACKPKNLPLGRYSQLEAVCKSSGCSWSNFTCACPKITTSTSSATPSTLINRVLPVVQGVSTGPNLFERILMFLQGK